MTCPWCDRDDLTDLTSAINDAVEAAVRSGVAFFVDASGRQVAGPVCVRCGDVAMRFGGDRQFANLICGGGGR